MNHGVTMIVGIFAVLVASFLSPAQASEKLHSEVASGFRRFEYTYKTGAGVKRTVKVYAWYPTSEKPREYDYNRQIGLVAPEGAVADGSHPLIVFSHGYSGRGDQTIFLMEALARAGFIVVAPDHLDSLGSERRAAGLPNFIDAKSWDDKKFLDRKEDVAALLDEVLRLNVETSSWLNKHVDAARIGAAGHSLGGYIILGMCGAWPSWRDDRIHAALLLSPYCTPFETNGAAGKITVPVMLQGGTLDFGITPFLPKLFQMLCCQRYFLVLKGETHFAWTNLISLNKTTIEAAQKGNGKQITDYSLAFFRQYLMQQDQSKFLNADNSALSSYKTAPPSK